MAKEDRDDTERSVWAELKGSGLILIALFAVGLTIIYGVTLVRLSHPQLTAIGSLGQFGDAFGALTSFFNALAFAAVVVTVVLQSRELRDSRKELRAQAEAQRAWAEAASQQIELTKQLEAVRIRPFIKGEWHLTSDEGLTHEYRVRNVGLGVALLTAIELSALDRHFGLVHSHGDDAVSQWRDCLNAAVEQVSELRIKVMQFNDLNRALAPNEPQALVRVRFMGAGDSYWRALGLLQQNFAPIVYFFSASGEPFSTLNQFEMLRKEASSGT